MSDIWLKALIIGCGGFFGSISRYFISLLVQSIAKNYLPFGTFTVNLLGSFLIGFVMGLISKNSNFSDNWRVFLTTGFLGGFTTFSTFSLDTVMLFRNNQINLAILNIFLHFILCLIATWFGFGLTSVNIKLSR